jgi:tetratricopeptide (TPR) repeat protein
VVLTLLLLLTAASTFEETYRAGLLALQRNDLSSAREKLLAAADLSPSNGGVWIALAEVYAKTGNLHEATETAAKAAALAPGDSGIRSLAVKVCFDAVEPLIKAQKFAESASLLENVRKRLGPNAQIELALGVSYYGLRRFNEAADAFLSTIAVAPETDQPYIFLGRIINQIPGRQAEATRRFAQYEAAHPESPAGYLLHAQGLDAQAIEPEKARALLEKSLSLDSANPAAHFELGSLLDQVRDFEAAAREFERAVALNSADAATHYRLARVYDRLGKHEAARKEREIHESLVKSQEPLR